MSHNILEGGIEDQKRRHHETQAKHLRLCLCCLLFYIFRDGVSRQVSTPVSQPSPFTDLVMSETARPRLSLVTIGHYNSGKSTIAGHLLYQRNAIDAKTISKYEKESTSLHGKPSTKFAWVLDNVKAEREKSMTIDISLWRFESVKNDFTIIDTPGYRDFIKNTITGVAQADAALLAVDATQEGFEKGMAREGQTREHALLAFTLGVKQLVVAVNKMDEVGYSEKRYNEVKSEVSSHLKKLGFKLSKITIVPVSGWEGINLSKKPTCNMEWYEGPTLLEALDNLIAPKRPTDKPLRIPIQVRYSKDMSTYNK